MGSIATADRRDPTAPRRPFTASIDLGNDKAIQADAIDLSVGGMSVRSPLLPDLGEQLAFRFMLEDGKAIDGRAEVVWCHDEGSRSGAFGVKFLAMQGDARASLRRTLEPLPTRVQAAENKVRLHLDSMDAPFRAKLRERVPGAVVVGHDLSFLKLGGKVTVEGTKDNEPGVISSVEVEIDPITRNPRLILTIDLDGGPPRTQRIASVAKAPVTAALIDAAKVEAPKAEAVVAEPVKVEAPKAEPPRIEPPRIEPAMAKTVEAPADRAIDTAPNETPSVRATARPKVTPAPVEAPSAVDSADDDIDDEFPAGPSWMQRTVGAARSAWEGTRRIATPVAAGVVKGVGALRARFQRQPESEELDETPRNGLRPQHLPSMATASDPDGTISRKRNRRVVMYALAAAVLTVAILALAIGGGPSATAPHPQVAVTADPAPAAELVAPAPAAAPTGVGAEGTTEEPVPMGGPEPRVVAASNHLPADLQGAAISNAGQVEGSQPLIVQGPARARALSPVAARPLAAAGPRPMLTASPLRPAALGNANVRVGTRLALRMDGPVTTLSGPGTRGNTIVVVVPGRRSLDLAAALARLDSRIANAGVINRAAGAELTLHFREAAPPFFAHARGTTLEVILGATPGAPRRAVAAPVAARAARR